MLRSSQIPWFTMYLKQLLFILLSAISVHVYAQWSDDMYTRYMYTNYTDYSAFNQSIEETEYNAHLLEAAIFYETNYQRVKHGLSQLRHEYNLSVCAHNHSVEMVQQDFFSHTSPIPGKERMKDRLAQVGYKNCASAENIAICPIQSTYSETARYLIEIWMDSPGHRENILTGQYTHLGCGAAFYYEDSFVYVKATQNFIKK